MGIWGETLSHTQQQLLSLARALIANPEFLVAHKPTLGFDHACRMIVLQALKDFVRKRGLEQDEQALHLRRPRTCIFSLSAPTDTEGADCVYEVSDAHGIQCRWRA